MSQIPVEKKRNVVLIGHPGSGKTSLVEALLYHLGQISRMGKPEDGNTFSDFTDEEKSRQASIYTTLVRLNYRECAINLLDTPGYPDFIGEIKGSMRVADVAVAVLDASSGLEVELHKNWQFIEEFDLPVIVFINKMNRERADFAATLQQLKDRLKIHAIPFQIPIGAEAGFEGVVDVIGGKALRFDAKGKIRSEDAVPDDISGQVESSREIIMDFAAEQDESVMEKYLEGAQLTAQEVAAGLRAGVAGGSVVPVFCGSATECIGIQPLLDAIVDLAPSPARKTEIEARKVGSDEKVTLPTDEGAPFAGLVFRTSVDPYSGRLSFFRVCSGSLTADLAVHNVGRKQSEKIAHILEVNGKGHTNVAKASRGDICALAKLDVTMTGDTLAVSGSDVVIPPTEYPRPTMQMAITAASKQDEEKIGNVIGRVSEADPTLTIERNIETRELIMKGMGEQHLDVAIQKMKNIFGLDVALRLPRVAYKETITGSGEGSYRHKKQSGGHGQFGEVHLRIKPLGRGEGFKFTDSIVGGAIPNKFIPSVEKGVRERMERGILAGYEVVDAEAELFFGKDHAVDSSDIAFKIAGSMGFQEVARLCRPILLEPIMNVEVHVPEEYMGDVISDLNTKRGKIMGMDSKDGMQVIRAQVPLGEMFRYAVDLRSISRSWGTFTMDYSHYEPVPKDVADKVVAASKKDQAEE